MKNVIKKTCAIVMMTAVLFTAVAPKPVLAACSHGRQSTNAYTYNKLMGSSPCTVKPGSCVVYGYREYKVTRHCMDCGAILAEVATGNTHTVHSGSH